MSDNEYRIIEDNGWFEPQIKYTSAKGAEEVWYSLNDAGYFLEPDAYNYGVVTKRLLFKERAFAESIVNRAKSVNQENIKLIKITEANHE